MISCIVLSDFTGGSGTSADGAPLTQDVLNAHADAIREQLNGPYASAWDSAQVNVRVGAPNGADVGPSERLLGYWQTSDVAGAAGYHTTTPTGQPYGKVFLEDAATMSSGPQAASVIASHEACEMNTDPCANLMALRADGATWDMYEVCDAVEDTTYTASNGVEVSNFLTQAAFDPGSAGPWDQLNVLTDQYGTTPGGYRSEGTIQTQPDGTSKFVIVAKGPGLSDERKLSRKKREQSRARMRGAVFEDELPAAA